MSIKQEKVLLIVNKSGSLIYSSTEDGMSNKFIVLGSVIHSLFEMGKNAIQIHRENDEKTENNSQVIEYENHKIHCFKTLSNTLFIFLWDNTAPPFQQIYLHYAEQVMLNYNYKLEMPINISTFQPIHLF